LLLKPSLCQPSTTPSLNLDHQTTPQKQQQQQQQPEQHNKKNP